MIESLYTYFMDPTLFESRKPEEVQGKRAGAEDPDGDDVPEPEEEPVAKKEKRKKPGAEEEEEEMLDWWTRFYATLRDMDDAEEELRLQDLITAGIDIKPKRKLPFKV